ncbi:hypothetical protein FQN60_006109 [Etheostoma spectabile]|uniref:Laminin G domain-containing protein n=1 Tax=Etheostoma spectabile TaxID=54343 RepID=A0A5J5CKG6_9PERO|nr:hypothetical protein FQN60_006109 [Etheostoma spectabile]
MTRGLRFFCWPLWPVALFSLLTTVKMLEFGGAPGQWARYGRWEAGSVGELSFSLKTNISKALVLYLDDGGNCDFLELLIAGGRLQLRFAIHCAEPATVHMETRVNDDRWHMVLLTRNFRETLLMVDGETKVAEVKSKRKEMAVVSDLFVGGIPPDVRLSALTSSTVKYEPPFQGLISNLKVGEMPPNLLNSQGIQSDLEYLCTKQNPCFNGGFCSIQYGEVHCDCTLTRFKGKYCKEEECSIVFIVCFIAVQQLFEGYCTHTSQRRKHLCLTADAYGEMQYLIEYMETSEGLEESLCACNPGALGPHRAVPDKVTLASLDLTAVIGSGGWWGFRVEIVPCSTFKHATESEEQGCERYNSLPGDYSISSSLTMKPRRI